MPDDRRPPRGPGLADHALSALSAWMGGYLAESGNELHQPLGFYEDNAPVAPEALPAPTGGKVCVLVHGLGCNEGLWAFPAPHPQESYGSLLARDRDYLPLYVRFNTGLHVSDNGHALATVIDAYQRAHGDALRELLLIGHSMGGLVIRSACHLAERDARPWVGLVRHCIYLGAPHLGAPLEKAAHVAGNVLGMVDTTATRVISDLIKTRSSGIKDLRHGSLTDEDWLGHDPDALAENRRVPVPWLSSARHHRIVGQAVAGAGVFGDAMVMTRSAAGESEGEQPSAPGADDVTVMPGLDHLSLARHPAVYAQIERILGEEP